MLARLCAREGSNPGHQEHLETRPTRACVACAADFPAAHVWGIDPIVGRAQNNARLRNIAAALNTHFAALPRVHLSDASAYDRGTPARLGLRPETMDVIIDDARHDLASYETALAVWWPLVRPGGFYFIEDVAWRKGSRAGEKLDLLETALQPRTRLLPCRWPLEKRHSLSCWQRRAADDDGSGTACEGRLGRRARRRSQAVCQARERLEA